MVQQRGQRRRDKKLRVASQVTVVLAALLTASSIASTSAIALERPNRDTSLFTRHGDHEHAEMASVEGTTKSVIVGSESSSSIPLPTHSSHSHHGNHSHEPQISMYPDPLAQTSETFISIPPLPSGAGGHTHGGHGMPQLELNESSIVTGKGPDPLSYIEWDFAFGIGKTKDLLRFSSASQMADERVMGVGGERWRTLVDEKDGSMIKSIASDIHQRVKENPEDPGRHKSLLVLHVVGCIISCFVLLPIVLALRSANSSFAPLTSLIYIVSLMGSLFMSKLYKAMTPQLYPSNSHGGLGYAIFWISVLVFGGDIFKLLMQIFATMKSIKRRSKKMTLKTVMQAVSLSTQKKNIESDSYDALEEERMLLSAASQERKSDAQEIVDLQDHNSESEPLHVHFAQAQLEEERIPHRMWSSRNSSRQNSSDLPSPASTLCNTPRTSTNGETQQQHHHHQQHSPLSWKFPVTSENSSRFANQERVASWRRFDNLQQSKKGLVKVTQPKGSLHIFKTILVYSHIIVARSLPVLSFTAAYTGLAIYTGSCRGPYKNVCLAHGIKGGIFFWYGLLSFARYLGAYADLGWAWNRQPLSKEKKKGGVTMALSAEFVECFVIFFYGATNTWMERFGAKAGDPYSVKQVQHISIAVMFWFAGIMGMILETRTFKNLLALPVALKQADMDGCCNDDDDDDVKGITCEEAIALPAKPPSYNFSFNPFPALVIGITGIAMAAHHQDYIYEVSIHSLWGNLLAGFSIFRILTYFFLFLRPPTSSIMPSRPPTEILASFCLTSGGLVFMLSSEEVSFVAIRNGFGDFMMILNLTVAIVSFLFCGIAGLMILKAFAIQREKKKVEKESKLGLENVEIHPSSQTCQAIVEQDNHSRPVFVLEDEEEAAVASPDEKRQILLTSSPVTL